MKTVLALTFTLLGLISAAPAFAKEPAQQQRAWVLEPGQKPFDFVAFLYEQGSAAQISDFPTPASRERRKLKEISIYKFMKREDIGESRADYFAIGCEVEKSRRIPQAGPAFPATGEARRAVVPLIYIIFDTWKLDVAATLRRCGEVAERQRLSQSATDLIVSMKSDIGEHTAYYRRLPGGGGLVSKVIDENGDVSNYNYLYYE